MEAEITLTNREYNSTSNRQGAVNMAVIKRSLCS